MSDGKIIRICASFCVWAAFVMSLRQGGGISEPVTVPAASYAGVSPRSLELWHTCGCVSPKDTQATRHQIVELQVHLKGLKNSCSRLSYNFFSSSKNIGCRINQIMPESYFRYIRHLEGMVFQSWFFLLRSFFFYEEVRFLMWCTWRVPFPPGTTFLWPVI